ncbi:hypothetical protein [Acinetobacter sp. RW6]|uniref:hypothetical protein n=1 Tax=Acinetobacter sp. RW6 TaxID=3242680 RepID=UPI0035C267B9
MGDFILEQFSIYGLNGEYKVDLDIVDNKKILVSENGSGKTTILGIFYSFFKKNNNIDQYNFEYIKLKIRNDENDYIFHKGLLKVIFDEEFFEEINSIDLDDRIKLEKNITDLKEKIKKFNDRDENVDTLITSLFIYYFFDDEFSSRKIFYGKKTEANDVFRKKINHYVAQNFKNIFNDIFSYYRMKDITIDFNNLYSNIDKVYKMSYKKSSEIYFLINWLNKLHDLMNSFDNKEVLYLTTYRVIEKNISTFEPEEDDPFGFSGMEGAKELFKDSPLIQFGMEKVKNIWMDLSNKIRTSTTEEFLKLSGTLLKNVVENKKVEEKDIQDLRDSKNSISKVLSRIDQKTFDYKDKKRLMDIIESKEVNLNKTNLALFYILQNMVSIYENQKHIDQAINKYCNAINSFFENKKVIFNDITSEIYVEITKNKKIIDIEDLSSGEKQIISLFTKLYLTNIENNDLKYWIIYDEPEISLSIEWQQLLLPQILNSERCEFLLSATHSPFIFKNELKKYTSDLALEISEI